MKQSFAWAALAAALLAFAPLNHARADEATDEFKAHVQKAKVHYDLGEFDDAAEEYIQAYRIKPVAGALFNIAQAYRQGGKYDKSRQFYRSYLREANPDAKGRAAVEKQIKELDELVAKEEKTKRTAPMGVEASLTPKDDLAPPPVASKPEKAKPAPVTVDADLAPPPIPSKAVAQTKTPAAAPAPIPAKPAPSIAPAPTVAANTPPSSTTQNAPAKVAVVETKSRPPPSSTTSTISAPPSAVRSDATIETQAGGRSHTLAYVTAGAGLVLLGGGAFFGIQAARADNELNAGAHQRADADALISTSKTDHLVSAVLLAAGGVAVVGAGLLYFLPTSGPNGGSGAAVGGRF